MPIDNDLNTRLDRSLKELGDVTVSLQHVKRLADTQHASTEHLSNITAAMIGVANQLSAVLASVGQSGSALQSAADLLKTVDVKAGLSQIDLELKASSRDLQAVRQEIQSLRLQSDLAVQQGEHNQTELTNLSNAVNGSISNAEASRSSLAASVVQLETFVSDKFSGLSNALQALEKRGRISILGTWLVVVLSAAAVLTILALLPQ